MSRTILRCSLVALSLAVGVAFQAASAAAETIPFKAVLKGKTGKGAGLVKATYNTSNGMLSWTATYAGLSGPPTAAHFHGPAEPGADAGVQVPSGLKPMAGEAVIGEGQYPDLMANRWYFNIHTKAAPGGEIRGQLIKAR